MSIDICITTHHSPNKLAKCLSAITQHANNVEYNVLLWCNEADDEDRKAIEQAVALNDRIRPIFNPDNNGSFSSNNNACVDRGNAEYILFLNDDCYAQRDDWLFNMQKILETDEKVGAVGALLLYPDGKTIQHCGVFFSSRTNNLPYHMHYRKSLEQVKNFVQVPRYYQAVTGACMLMRRKDFEDIGGLDKVYWYMYEDIKFCLDIKSKLQKFCVFCPGAILIHDEGISRDGKQNPKFRENIETFKKQCAGMYYNDLEFYLSNPKHMIYKHKA